MLTVFNTNKYKKDLKRLEKQHRDISALNKIVEMLAKQEVLDPSCRDHPLNGEFEGCRGCHIGFDWVLVYKVENDNIVLVLMRTGTHTEVYD
jgi:mRNA interferase YafQ